ncbi:MAG TPA: CHAD domain-containing protein [Puia sp.]|nr:CHAD domain-containing protein [Puia sp.]
MSGKKAHNSTRKYGKRLSTLGGQIALRFDVNCIHDFRTTFKKLRALSRWLSPVKRPLTKSFTEVYHLSGELRNAQVILKDTETQKEELRGFGNWLTTSIPRLEEQWYKIFDPSVARRLREKIERWKTEKADQEGLYRFCRKRVNRIRGILYIPSPPDESLHEARKMLKDMQYVYEWSEKKEVTQDRPTLEILKRIGHQAGIFNDKRIAVLQLIAYLEKETPEDSQTLVMIKSQWEESREKQKQELIATLDGFVNGNKWE